MTRLYVTLAILTVLASGAAYLRWDAIQDERRATQLQAAKKYERDRKEIDNAIQDSRDGTPTWNERLCAVAPDRCGL